MDFTTQGKNYTAEELAVHLEREANKDEDDCYDWTVEWDGTHFVFTPHFRPLFIGGAFAKMKEPKSKREG